MRPYKLQRSPLLLSAALFHIPPSHSPVAIIFAVFEMADVRLLFGPILIGVCLNMILYGVLLVQMYHYYVTYGKRDAPWIRYLVYYLLLVETFNTASDMSIVFEPLVDNFGKEEATKFFPTMFAAQPVMVVAVSTPIQLFFAWRIWLLTKSRIIACVVVAFALVSLGGGICTTALIVKIDLLFARKPELHWPALVWFLAACIADMIIAGILVVTLSRCKTGFAATDDAITRLIKLTVQTGLLTAFFAIMDVVFFMYNAVNLSSPTPPNFQKTALNFVWDLALSKLYSNCLLSGLNARLSLSIQADSGYRRQIEGPFPSGSLHQRGDIDIKNSSAAFELETRGMQSSYTPSTDMEYGVVTVTKVVETKRDPMLRNDACDNVEDGTQ